MSKAIDELRDLIEKRVIVHMTKATKPVDIDVVVKLSDDDPAVFNCVTRVVLPRATRPEFENNLRLDLERACESYNEATVRTRLDDGFYDLVAEVAEGLPKPKRTDLEAMSDLLSEYEHVLARLSKTNNKIMRLLDKSVHESNGDGTTDAPTRRASTKLSYMLRSIEWAQQTAVQATEARTTELLTTDEGVATQMLAEVLQAIPPESE